MIHKLDNISFTDCSLFLFLPFFFFFPVMLRIKPNALHMLGKYCTPSQTPNIT